MSGPSLLSIVTPTYNRAHLLNNCFLSLKSQSNPAFEWIVVDDGSTDGTKALVASFIDQAPEMRIIYVEKQNGGKHTALNASHPFIRGDLVLILDSDDTLTETAVDDVFAAWTPYYDRETIGAVVLLRGKTPTQPVAYAERTDTPVDLLKCRRICVHGSDCCEVIRAELFKQFPFPQYPGEKFISEGVLWKKVNQDHRYVYVNKIIYLCDYLEGGLTKSGPAMRIRSPLGGMLNSFMNMNPKNSLGSRVKNGLLYTCYGFFAGFGAKQLIHKEKEYKGLRLLCLIPGYFLYVYWKRKYSGS